MKTEVENIKAKYRILQTILVAVLAAALATALVVPFVQAKYVDQLNLLANTGVDGVTNRDLIDALWPVGSIYFSVSNANPGEAGGVFKGTKWVAWGQGRVPVGMGSNGTTSYTSIEATGGSDSVILTKAQLPNIRGSVDFNIGGQGRTELSVTGPDFVAGTSVVSRYPQQSSSDGGSNPKSFSINVGSGQAHENRMPYITCYMWKRIPD